MLVEGDERFKVPAGEKVQSRNKRSWRGEQPLQRPWLREGEGPWCPRGSKRKEAWTAER